MRMDFCPSLEARLPEPITALASDKRENEAIRLSS